MKYDPSNFGDRSDAGVNHAEGLLVEAYELFEAAADCLDRRDYKALVPLLRQASEKHGAIAVLYAGLASEFDRLNFS